MINGIGAVSEGSDDAHTLTRWHRAGRKSDSMCSPVVPCEYLIRKKVDLICTRVLVVNVA